MFVIVLVLVPASRLGIYLTSLRLSSSSSSTSSYSVSYFYASFSSSSCFSPPSCHPHNTYNTMPFSLDNLLGLPTAVASPCRNPHGLISMVASMYSYFPSPSCTYPSGRLRMVTSGLLCALPPPHPPNCTYIPMAASS